MINNLKFVFYEKESNFTSRTPLRFLMVSWRWCWSVLLLYLSLVQAAIVIVVIVSCDGAVYKCSERDFTEEHRDGQLMPDGTIKWKEEKLKQLLDIVTYDTPMCRNYKFLTLCWGPC